MKSAVRYVMLYLLAMAPVVGAESTKLWPSPNHAEVAVAQTRFYPDKPDRTDLSWQDVSFKNAKGRLLASLSLEEGSGVNRAVVTTAAWAPDARFFVFATTSSGGHSSWHMPSYVYDVKTSRIYSIDDTIGNTTDDNPQFELSRSDVLKISFWDGKKAEAEAAPRMIDLRDFVKKGPKLALHAKCFVHVP